MRGRRASPRSVSPVPAARLASLGPAALLTTLARTVLLAALAGGLPAAARAQGAAARPHFHRLPAGPSTVAWGYYWSKTKPVLRIASGDTVEVTTMITSTPKRLEGAGVPADRIQPALRAIVDSVTDKGPGGHILNGPIYVEGAEPGDVLQVDFLSMKPAIDYSYNGCRGFLPEACGEPGMKIVPLDLGAMTAEVDPGIVVPLHPFFGSAGVAPPPDSGRLGSNPPGRHAGNLDDRRLVAGTTLYIPVFVPGALFEIGDGHAAQGDGEVDQTALETSLTGRVRLTVRKDMRLSWPRAETPTDYITMGMDPDLTKATRIAIRNAIGFLEETRGLSSVEAYRLVSVACDVQVTELVDGNVGVHVLIPKSLFRKDAGAAGS